MVAQRVPSEAVAEGMDDGGVSGFGGKHGVVGSVEGQGRGCFFIKQLVVLVFEAMVDAPKGEPPFGDSIYGDGVVDGDGFLLVLRQEVEIVLESRP